MKCVGLKRKQIHNQVVFILKDIRRLMILLPCAALRNFVGRQIFALSEPGGQQVEKSKAMFETLGGSLFMGFLYCQ